MDLLSTLIVLFSRVVLVAALLNPLRPLDDSARRGHDRAEALQD